MQVQVSETFLKWYKDNRNKPGLLEAVDDFLFMAFQSTDVAQLGAHQKSEPGGVYSFRGTTGNHGVFRLYCSAGLFRAVPPLFRLAVVGLKQKKSDQNDDILSAQRIIANRDEKWQNWQPTRQKHLDEMLHQMSEQLGGDDTNILGLNVLQIYDEPEPVPQETVDKEAQKARKQAERKAAQERKKAEKEKQRQQRLAEQAKKRQLKKAQRTDTATATEINMDSDQGETMASNQDKVDTLKEQLGTIQGTVAASQPASDDSNNGTIKNDGDVLVDNNTVPDVVVNGVKQQTNVSIVGNPIFHDVDTEYELAVLEHKMNIESAKIAIAQYNIALEQSKIELEKLAIQKLNLLQAQKQQPSK